MYLRTQGEKSGTCSPESFTNRPRFKLLNGTAGCSVDFVLYFILYCLQGFCVVQLIPAQLSIAQPRLGTIMKCSAEATH